MPTENRNSRHNVNWHARPANDPVEVIGFIGDIEYTYIPSARDAEGPFMYDPYSQPAYLPAHSPDAGDRIGERFNPLFQSGRVDPEAGLMDFRHRDIHPGIARWMDQEPLAYVDGLNVYSAPVDEPVNPINPLGT